jgi:uncharacterized membrane protein YadS
MVMVVALSLLKSVTDLPGALLDVAAVVSPSLLVTVIAALGIKTSLRAMRELGGGHWPTGDWQVSVEFDETAAIHLFDVRCAHL